MKTLRSFLIFALILYMSGLAFAADVEDRSDDNQRDTGPSAGSQVLTGALMGGLLGGGVGAAIGSASGNAGKGALIGAGVGAVGGSVLGASQADKDKRERESYRRPQVSQQVPKDTTIKKKVIREYDEQGNVISEKEVNN